ncbi:unnamed protein product [Chondrus crispus]|uniref:Uncharacterized protein n=1 Tax=Chondrus crispus TaxID=2769 RepID=R7QNV7_CHOCR|nr:unnamed protein product [Chondrus crispus]CDF39784.1 unnamed protein product [Chondrus crispus]|eukprot:XP_005710078.1 unnamed protein product [Chondrus crispus]
MGRFWRPCGCDAIPEAPGILLSFVLVFCFFSLNTRHGPPQAYETSR